MGTIEINTLLNASNDEPIAGRLRKGTKGVFYVSDHDAEMIRRTIGSAVHSVEHDYAAKRADWISSELSEAVAGMYKGAEFDIWNVQTSKLVMVVERDAKKGLVSFQLV